MNYQVNLVENNGKKPLSRPVDILLTLLFALTTVFLLYVTLFFCEQYLTEQVSLAETELLHYKNISAPLLELKKELDNAERKINIFNTLFTCNQSCSSLITEIRSRAFNGIDLYSIIIDPGSAAEITGRSFNMHSAAAYREILADLNKTATADLLEVSLADNGYYTFTIVLNLGDRNGGYDHHQADR